MGWNRALAFELPSLTVNCGRESQTTEHKVLKKLSLWCLQVYIVLAAVATESNKNADLYECVQVSIPRISWIFLDVDNILFVGFGVCAWDALTSCRQVDSLSVWRHFLSASVWLSLLRKMSRKHIHYQAEPDTY